MEKKEEVISLLLPVQFVTEKGDDFVRVEVPAKG